MKKIEIKYDYTDVPTLYEFSKSNALVRGLMGPFGCIAGDTEVITEFGAIPISDIDRPMRVLSWNEKKSQFQLSPSGGAFPKGEDCLYQVSTPQGGFVAAGFHRVLCADGSYRSVDSLSAGQFLSAYSPSPHPTTWGRDHAGFRPDDPSYDQTVVDLMGHYAGLARQYGQRLLLGIGSAQGLLPSEDGASVLSRFCVMGGIWREDAPLVQKQSHSRSGQFAGHIQTGDFLDHSESRVVGDPIHAGSPLSSRIADLILQFRQPLLRIAYRCIGKLFSKCYRSSDYSISERPILDVKRLSVKQSYWDMQVLDTNNYVTSDGTIHHNSGKSSGCVVEIVRRALEQAPSSDGIRRSKWAVIRNTYRQLEDTSLRTFLQWFPVSDFGDFLQKDMKYTIRAFKDCEIEILFRALDRPDQVDNLLSLELTGAWVNEAREVPWTIIQALIGRVGRYPQGNLGSWYGLIMDTNPPDNDSWWYKQFEEKKPEGWEIFKQPSGLDPKAENTTHLPANYYKNMISSMEPEVAKVYVHGEYGFVIDGKPVYHEYNDSTHCKDVSVTPKQIIYRGWDFGLTPACVFTQFINGKLIIFDEMVSESMGADTFSDEVIAHCNTQYPKYEFKDIGDPAGNTRSQADEKTCFQILWAKGINIEPGEQTLSARIESVKKPLNTLVDGKPCLQMSPKCKTLRKGFQGGYMFKRVRVSEERYKDEPFKNNYSHIHDALQYVCTRLFFQHLITQENPIVTDRYKKIISRISSAWAI